MHPLHDASHDWAFAKAFPELSQESTLVLQGRHVVPLVYVPGGQVA